MPVNQNFSPFFFFFLGRYLNFLFFFVYSNSCGGNYQCITECNAPKPDRCSGCNTYNDDQSQLLTNCVPGNGLYFVQVPKNINMNDFVSNPSLLSLYTNSNLELDSSGISGRACLNDRSRFDLQRLNATIQPITNG